MERTNKIFIVGTLFELPSDKLRTGEKDGVKWIGGTAMIQVTEENQIEVKFYAMEKTKDGKANKRYSNYVGLEKMIGEKIKVNGELQGRAFYNASQGQITTFNEINAGFFNSAKAEDKNVATFEYAGFITKPLHERLNKEEKLVAYEMEIGQANYHENNMQVFKFTVDKDNQKIKNAIENNYTKNTTVYITGDIRHVVTMGEKVEEVDFGKPIVKTFQNVLKTYVITGGKNPIVEEGMAYTTEEINELQKAYNQYLADIEEEAKNQAPATKSEPAQSSNANKLL